MHVVKTKQLDREICAAITVGIGLDHRSLRGVQLVDTKPKHFAGSATECASSEQGVLDDDKRIVAFRL